MEYVSEVRAHFMPLRKQHCGLYHRLKEFKDMHMQASCISTCHGRLIMKFYIDHMLDLIREKACCGLRAKDLVRKIPGSRRYVEIQFKKLTGLSIQQEICRVRFESAKVALANPDLTLVGVVLRCGYRSVPTFCREFKRRMGISPRKWRDRSQKDNFQ